MEKVDSIEALERRLIDFRSIDNPDLAEGIARLVPHKAWVGPTGSQKTAEGLFWLELSVLYGHVAVVFGVKDEITTFNLPQQNEWFLKHMRDMRDSQKLDRIQATKHFEWVPRAFERSVVWIPPPFEEWTVPYHFRVGKIPVGSLTPGDFSMFQISEQAELVLSAVLGSQDRPRTVEEFAEMLRWYPDRQIARLLSIVEILCNQEFICDDGDRDRVDMHEVLMDAGNIHSVFLKGFSSFQGLRYFYAQWWNRQILLKKSTQSRYLPREVRYPPVSLYYADAELFIPSTTKYRQWVSSVAPHLLAMSELGRDAEIFLYADFHRWKSVYRQFREQMAFVSFRRGSSEEEVKSASQLFNCPYTVYGKPASFEPHQALWMGTSMPYKLGILTNVRMTHHPYAGESLQNMYRKDQLKTIPPPSGRRVRLATSRQLEKCSWLPLVGKREVTEEDVKRLYRVSA